MEIYFMGRDVKFNVSLLAYKLRRERDIQMYDESRQAIYRKYLRLAGSKSRCLQKEVKRQDRLVAERKINKRGINETV